MGTYCVRVPISGHAEFVLDDTSTHAVVRKVLAGIDMGALLAVEDYAAHSLGADRVVITMKRQRATVKEIAE